MNLRRYGPWFLATCLATGAAIGAKITFPDASADSKPSAALAPSDAVIHYVVVANDSWIGIANQYNLSGNDLARQNRSTIATVLQPGMILHIIPGPPPTTTLPPSSTSTTSPPTTTTTTVAPTTTSTTTSTTTTTVAPSGCPCTIFPPSTVPAIQSFFDPGAVELGVKFRTSQAGFVTGVRFFKGSGNAGTHVGSLWSAGGTRLATATFTGESATGWQQVNFTTPVAVQPGVTYIASYHAPTGNYALQEGGFATAVVRAPLTALADGFDGGNGVYAYGASSFPTSTDSSSNYYVDVVFDTSGTPPPTTTTTTTLPPTEGFVETFSDPSGFYERFRLDVHFRDAGPNVDRQKIWPGDHNMNCEGPTTVRNVSAAVDANLFWWCGPGGADTGHVMTSMGDIDGYTILSFSPDRAFLNIDRVCWDVNLTYEGGRKWTQVAVIPRAAYEANGQRIDYISPLTQDVDQTAVRLPAGAFMYQNWDGKFRLYQGQTEVLFDWVQFFTSDKAKRYKHCLTDNNDGTVTMSREQDNGTHTRTVSGSLPNDAVVIFQDDNYTPDKDGEAFPNYTWHWDNVIID